MKQQKKQNKKFRVLYLKARYLIRIVKEASKQVYKFYNKML